MNEKQPTVSVVIPAYNSAQYLAEGIDSVLAQTYRDVETIVVDDGSTDNTQEVLARYGDRIRVVRQANAGRAAARNAGILAARGDYIAFLDADDLWLPQKLEKQMALFEERPGLGWVYCDYLKLYGDATATQSYLAGLGLDSGPQGWLLPVVLSHNITWTMTVVVRAECLRTTGLFDVSFAAGECYDLWLRLAAIYEAGCVPEVLALYRRHPAQVTSGKNPELTHRHIWRAMRKFVRRGSRSLKPATRREMVCIARRRMAEHALGMARLASARGDRLAVCGWLARSFAASLRTPPYRVGLLLETILPPAIAARGRALSRAVLRSARGGARDLPRASAVETPGTTRERVKSRPK